VRDKVLRYIREQKLMRAGDRVAVAVSGGADSAALLRVLLELRAEIGIVLAVAHFNHELRGEESAADEAFVAELAKEHGLDYFAGHGNVRDHAFTCKLGIEAAGRELRYRWFARLAEEQRFDYIATAHTADDQAETVLLKFLRGAGTRGLAGIWPVIGLEYSANAGAKAPIQEDASDGAAKAAPLQNRLYSARIVRPLLCVSREEVEAYLEALGQSWREDESNLDRRFLRNRVRHELLPLLEREYNPNIRRVLCDLADVARGEEEYWQREVERELTGRIGIDDAPGLKPQEKSRLEAGLKARASTETQHDDGPSADSIQALKARACDETDQGRLLIEGFAQLSVALQRRLVRQFAERDGLTLDFAHIEKLRRCALGEALRAELPGGQIAVRTKERLQLRGPARRVVRAYQYLLPIPGQVEVSELRLSLRAEIVPEPFARELPMGELLSVDSIGSEIIVRNWQPGDRFWPAHSRSEEKLKRLFAEKHIPAEQRPTWPVAVCADEIVWVRGFPVARAYQWQGRGDAVKIEVVKAKS
jgi:tRNA(Ile)-lysidine synthase